MGSVYKITIVKRDGTIKIRTHEGAPPDSKLCVWGTNLKAAFVIRFWPSKKGWIAIDIRNAQFFKRPNGFGQWIGHERSRVYPSEDAAVMASLHKANRV